MEFFVTCGSGLEPFVALELQQKFGDILETTAPESEEPKVQSGKIFFKLTSELSESSEVIHRLINNLKIVERLFGVVFMKESPRVESGHQLLNYLFKITSQPEVKHKLKQWQICSKKFNHFNGREPVMEESVVGGKKPRLGIGFRVNVKVTGRFRRMCNQTHYIAKCIGSAIVKTFTSESENWWVELRHPDTELTLYVTETGIILAISLTAQPISERPYLRHIPLRSTIASAMGSLLWRHMGSSAEPIALADPMCGAATILVELAIAHNFKILQLFGMDNDCDQVSRAKENIELAKLTSAVSVCVGDVHKRFPWKATVDGILCDLPFGQQHGKSEAEVKKTLPVILDQMDAAVRLEGIVILLFTAALSSFLEQVVEDKRSWTLLDKFPVKLGELPAHIFAFKKITLVAAGNITAEVGLL